jgi:hypothetical protein
MAKKNDLIRPERIYGGYAGIPWVVIDSNSFKGATDKAKALLFALMRQHTGHNNGRLHLAKKWLYAQGWTCDENNRNACRELIERGLVIQTKWGGLKMGPNYYALTWHDISNYVGLDIGPKGYIKSAYALCDLPPTPRRKQPVKKSVQPDSRDRISSTTATDTYSLGSIAGPTEHVFKVAVSSTTDNDVIKPLPGVKKRKRVVGRKGKSGILRQNHTEQGMGYLNPGYADPTIPVHPKSSD